MGSSTGGTQKGSPDKRLAPRLVQAAFLVALIALWYLGTNHWGINPLLLPKPQNVAVRVRRHPALRRVLAGSSADARRTRGRIRHFDAAWPCHRLPGEPVAGAGEGVRAAARRLLRDPDHPFPAALCSVPWPRTGLEDCARGDDQLLPHRAQYDRGLHQRRQAAHHRCRARWARRTGRCSVMCWCPAPCRSFSRVCAWASPSRCCRSSAARRSPRWRGLATASCIWRSRWIWRACSPTSSS